MKPFFVLCLFLPLLFSCTATSSDAETTQAMCSDGIDNDVNGYTDCKEASCASFCSSTSTTDEIVTPVRYPYGIQPTTVNMTRQRKLFNSWLANHYEENADQTMARVSFQGGGGKDQFDRTISITHTVSEGIAYGMLIMVAMDTLPDRFNRLWAYYYAHEDLKGLMHWMTYLFEPEAAKNGSASDADLDAATALLMAQKKWGDAAGNTVYLDAAKTLITAIQTYEIDVNSHLTPGDGWGASGVTVKNPGYTATAAFNAFAMATGDATWNSILAANYDQLIQCQNPTTGVIPDWCMASEATTVDSSMQGSSRSHDFNLEAVRMPWRLALDYYWNGSLEAQGISKKFSDYLQTITAGDATRLSQGYSWAGAQLTGKATPMFLGAYALLFSQDASKQALVDYLYNSMIASDIPGYYESSLQLIYSCTLAGLLPNPSVP